MAFRFLGWEICCSFCPRRLFIEEYTSYGQAANLVESKKWQVEPIVLCPDCVPLKDIYK